MANVRSREPRESCKTSLQLWSWDSSREERQNVFADKQRGKKSRKKEKTRWKWQCISPLDWAQNFAPNQSINQSCPVCDAAAAPAVPPFGFPNPSRQASPKHKLRLPSPRSPRRGEDVTVVLSTATGSPRSNRSVLDTGRKEQPKSSKKTKQKTQFYAAAHTVSTRKLLERSEAPRSFEEGRNGSTVPLLLGAQCV